MNLTKFLWEGPALRDPSSWNDVIKSPSGGKTHKSLRIRDLPSPHKQRDFRSGVMGTGLVDEHSPLHSSDFRAKLKLSQ